MQTPTNSVERPLPAEGGDETWETGSNDDGECDDDHSFHNVGVLLRIAVQEATPGVAPAAAELDLGVVQVAARRLVAAWVSAALTAGAPAAPPPPPLLPAGPRVAARLGARHVRQEVFRNPFADPTADEELSVVRRVLKNVYGEVSFLPHVIGGGDHEEGDYREPAASMARLCLLDGLQLAVAPSRAGSVSERAASLPADAGKAPVDSEFVEEADAEGVPSEGNVDLADSSDDGFGESPSQFSFGPRAAEDAAAGGGSAAAAEGPARTTSVSHAPVIRPRPPAVAAPSPRPTTLDRRVRRFIASGALAVAEGAPRPGLLGAAGRSEEAACYRPPASAPAAMRQPLQPCASQTPSPRLLPPMTWLSSEVSTTPPGTAPAGQPRPPLQPRPPGAPCSAPGCRRRRSDAAPTSTRPSTSGVRRACGDEAEDEGRTEEQVALRQRFLENMKSAKAKEKSIAQNDLRSKEHRALVDAILAEQRRREEKVAMTKASSERRKKEEARRRALAEMTEQELHLRYGKMFVEAPTPGTPADAVKAGTPTSPGRRSIASRGLPDGGATGGKAAPPKEFDEAKLATFVKGYREALGRTVEAPRSPPRWWQGVLEQHDTRSLDGSDAGGLAKVVPNYNSRRASVHSQAFFSSEETFGRRRSSITPTAKKVRKANERRRSYTNMSLPSKGRRYSTSSYDTGVAGLKELFEEREGATLTAWLKHFDTNGDDRVSYQEFLEGVLKLGCDPARAETDARPLFEALDLDGDGELGLEDIDAAQARIWNDFRNWCAAKFDSCDHMVERFTHGAKTLTKDEFGLALLREGWQKGCETLLFESLDSKGEGVIDANSFLWFDVEKKRWRMKEAASAARARWDRSRRAVQRVVGQKDLLEFKQFLKSKYGSFLRAWRVALTANDSMTLHKPNFLKACAKLGWHGDAKLLWLAFDKDDSGSATLDELDFTSARLLAQFKVWITANYPNSAAAFAAIDKASTKQVKLDDFIANCASLGFTASKMLFHGLDKHAKKHLVEEDLAFVDRWRPLPFLLAEPNPEAAAEVKDLLIRRHNCFLTAWRQALDKDGSNRCNWFEFHCALTKLGYKGDMPGAWRALDEDMSGYITLREIDAASNEVLVNFRQWADDAFGGVHPAFAAFDVDGSNEISRSEFRQACRIFGFKGNALRLFDSLDVSGNGSLSGSELTFLDTWELSEEVQLEMIAKAADSGARGSVQFIAAPPVARNERRPSCAASEMSSDDERAEDPLAQLLRDSRKVIPPGLAAWQSRENPWHRPRKGALAPMETVVDALLSGRPPPAGVTTGGSARSSSSRRRQPQISCASAASTSYAATASCDQSVRSRWSPPPALPARAVKQVGMLGSVSSAG